MVLVKKIALMLLQVVGVALLAYFVYVLIASTVPYFFRPKVNPEARAVLERADYYGGEAPGPDKVLLIEQTTEAFGVRLALAREADETLDFVCHTMEHGDSSNAFLGELVAAAERGVKVRILLDGKAGVMAPSVAEALEAAAGHPNVECRLYNPPKTMQPWGWHSLLHDKFILVDGTQLLLGGRNIGDRFFGPGSHEGEMTDDRDVLVWNTGEKAATASVMPQVSSYMELLWNLPDTTPLVEGDKKSEISRLQAAENLVEYAGTFEKLNPAYYNESMDAYLERTMPTRKVTLLHNPVESTVKEPWVGYGLRHAAMQARHTVLVQTPYATANTDLLAAFAGLEERGVSVVMQTNSLATSPNYPAFSNYHSQRGKFLATGASIYEYQGGGSIHGKSLVIDGRLSAVGSFNLDDRSIYIDTETMLLIDSPEFAAALTGAIEDYQSASLVVGENNEYLPSADVQAAPATGFKKVMMRVASVFSRAFQFLI